MSYEYSGYLRTLLPAPDPKLLKSAESITFGPADLLTWRTEDLGQSLEWRSAMVRKSPLADGVRLEGDFSNIVNIDNLTPTDPRYWVPLATFGVKDDRLPIDVAKYPIIEVTYRCTSENAHPVWMWTYPGGSHFGALPKSKTWITVARNVRHFGFPSRVDNVVLRLYSAVRSVESLEVRSVRFRAMSPEEAVVLREGVAAVESHRPPKRFPVLDEFMPLGVYMDADSANRLAGMLGISPDDYWDLVIEDLVTHSHNAITLANFDRMKPEQRDGLLRRCEEAGIRLVVRHEFPIGAGEKEQQLAIDTQIRPTAGSRAILAREFNGEPVESGFRQTLEAKRRIEEADPDHPMAIVSRYPNAYPLFAPYFAASGVGYFASKSAWEVGTTVRTHVALNGGQQFWLAAAAFMYPTQTPAWSTCPEMRLMVNLAFANGARGWFAYSYHNDPVWLRGRLQRSLTGPFLTFSDLWSELMQRMRWVDALAPLLLASRVEDSMDEWFVRGVFTNSTVCPAPGVPPISQFHLRGDDFSLYFTVSNNTREIASVEVDIPKSAATGMQIHDLSEFVRDRVWRPIERRGHIEMFPGQARVLLVATPARSEEWRGRITERMTTAGLRKLRYAAALAQAYGLNLSKIGDGLAAPGSPSDLAHLDAVERSRDRVLELMYATPHFCEPHSSILQASSAICGCDGALCRLMELGKGHLARQIGTEVIPLAAELMGYRMAWRRGEGESVAVAAKESASRCVKLLARIRKHY